MIKIIKNFDWSAVKLAALTTKGLNPKTDQPAENWIKQAIISGHSILQFSQCLISADMLYKTASHLVRNNKKDGFYMVIQSQREDWTGEKRDPNRVVKTLITATPKAIIEISRERLCSNAADHTQTKWIEILQALNNIHILQLAVPNCVYRGFCPEFNCCGYVNHETFNGQRERYLKRCLEN